MGDTSHYVPLPPEPRAVRSLMRGGVFGVKEMAAMLVGKTLIKGEHGTFTILEVEAIWPYGNGHSHHMRFAADDSRSLGAIREWKLIATLHPKETSSEG